MPLDLIGAGFGRTGTLSLKAALEKIGLGPCHHMMEVVRNPGSERGWYDASTGVPTDWEVLLAGYRSVVDWPGCHFWRELCAAYPRARVLLSVRDPERWYESASETIYQGVQLGRRSENPVARAIFEMADKVVFQDTFRNRFEDRAFAISVFEAHNEAVKREIPAERLLVYEVAAGWGPLCAFLGRPVPDEPFPHVNSRDEFKGMLARANQGPAKDA